MKIAPFTIDVSSAAVADLARRLEMTRWPDEVGEGGWEYGMPCRVLRDVVDHWRDRFDWRAAERRLNGLPQFQIGFSLCDPDTVRARTEAGNNNVPSTVRRDPGGRS